MSNQDKSGVGFCEICYTDTLLGHVYCRVFDEIGSWQFFLMIDVL